jgi:hypothetical protein
METIPWFIYALFVLVATWLLLQYLVQSVTAFSRFRGAIINRTLTIGTLLGYILYIPGCVVLIPIWIVVTLIEIVCDPIERVLSTPVFRDRGDVK